MENISITSHKQFFPNDFVVNDFYDTAFSFALNSTLLYFKEKAIDDEELLKILSDEDFVTICINCNNEQYIIYHCFAGDNPSGLITKGTTILEQIGESVKELNILHGDSNVELIKKWYYDTTQNCCSYDQDYWYSQQRG